MLNAIIRFSLRNRLLIIFLSLAALGYGSYLTANLPIDVFPDLDRPRVVLLTEGARHGAGRGRDIDHVPAGIGTARS